MFWPVTNEEAFEARKATAPFKVCHGKNAGCVLAIGEEATAPGTSPLHQEKRRIDGQSGDAAASLRKFTLAYCTQDQPR
jgi:hypothetical protein